MMAHSKLTKCQMLDWIKSCLEQGTRMPNDGEIVDHFNLSGRESARVLLSDLADEGAIRIRWNEPGRPIELGPRERNLPTSPTPVPLIVKRDDAVDDGVTKIMSIVGRRLAKPKPARDTSTPTPNHVAFGAVARVEPPVALKPAPVASPPPAAAPSIPKPAPKTIAEIKDGLVSIAATQEAAGVVKMKRLPTVPGRDIARNRPPKAPVEQKLTVNSRVSIETFKAVRAISAADGKAMSPTATMLIEEALTARQGGKHPFPKPRISAAVMAAYIADGRGLDDFIAYLLALGLAQHKTAVIE